MIVLLTGAAGLLGGALAAQLVGEGHGVIAVVHHQHEIRGNDGALIPAIAFDGSAPGPGSVAVLKGDVTRPQLGFDGATIAALESCVDCIVHCAAMVKFEAPLEDLKAVNVEGTMHVADLCPQARFVHVSTAYVCGLQDGQVAEAASGEGGQYGNGYEQSKAMAETWLLAKRPDAVVARPSIVVGEHESGRIREFDTIYRAFKFIAEGRVKSLPVDSSATLNFVPIDYVASGIADLVSQGAPGPLIVHLAAKEAISAVRFLGVVGSVPGLTCPELLKPADYAQQRQGLTDRLAQPYWSYFLRSPGFVVDRLEKLTGRAAPAMDAAAFERQFAFCVSDGFIRPRG